MSLVSSVEVNYVQTLARSSLPRVPENSTNRTDKQRRQFAFTGSVRGIRLHFIIKSNRKSPTHRCPKSEL